MTDKIRLRLDRALTKLGFGTRKEVRALIKSRRVTVDGDVVTDHGFIITDPESAGVEVDGVLFALRQHTHLMLNKPVGYLTAHKDSRYPVVFDLIPEDLRGLQFTSAGRLDRDAGGLILLTTDGELAHRLMSPKYQVRKTYYIVFSGKPFTAVEEEKFSSGIVLEDKTECLPAKIKILSDQEILLTITEGKYHQVKRMVQAVSREVTDLRRLSIDGLQLDPELEEGEFRFLAREEALTLYKAVNLQINTDYL
ncbi:MAG: rRNA pseudouridine synthase [Clostridiaceae bacterium]|nr:rRNA pseudouridine synthase [Clostridiaceae bacterium]HZW97850.1 pseudouridine synthase [Bacillota bacterium]